MNQRNEPAEPVPDHECEWEEQPAGIVVLLDLACVRRVRSSIDNVDLAHVLLNHAEEISTRMQQAGAELVAELLNKEEQ